MREIKFRAWEKDAKHMTGFCTLDRVVANFHGLDDEQWSNLIWMQYTGLKDKDGVEICEGDVVLVPYNRIGNIEVKFNKGKYNIVGYILKELEIVGNIYENPELVEGTK